MWGYIARIELKKTFIQYFILFFFFFFWNFFSLATFNVYKNIQLLLKNYEKSLYLEVVFPPQQYSVEGIKNLINDLEKKEGIKEILVVSPEKIYRDIKKDTPQELLNVLSKEDVLSLFPYIIKIKVEGFKNFKQVKKELALVSKLMPFIKVKASRPNTLLKFSYLFDKFFYAISFTWFSFYLLFLIFLNNSINALIQQETRTFQLLGSSLFRLQAMRFSFFFICLAIAFVLSTGLFYFLMQNFLVSIVPFIKVYPNFFDRLQLKLFSAYVFVFIFLIPYLTITFSYKGYEV
jgi:hypothetical protein